MRALFFTLAVAAAFLAGCASGANVAAAAVNTAIAVGVAAERRAQGECYTPCVPGTACNKDTGMCDTIPCRGLCIGDEECLVGAGGLESCVKKPLTPLKIETKVPPKTKSAAPSDAPTAEPAAEEKSTAP